MAEAINQWFGNGNLTKDPETREYGSGETAGSVTTLRIACNRRAPKGGGESKADYIDIKVFGAQGRNCQQYLSKGRPISVVGRLQIDQVPSKDDPSKSSYFTSIIADKVQFLGSRDDNAAAAPAPSTSSESDLGF